jgi:hypothetical protein
MYNFKEQGRVFTKLLKTLLRLFLRQSALPSKLKFLLHLSCEDETLVPEIRSVKKVLQISAWKHIHSTTFFNF